MGISKNKDVFLLFMISLIGDYMLDTVVIPAEIILQKRGIIPVAVKLVYRYPTHGFFIVEMRIAVAVEFLCTAGLHQKVQRYLMAPEPLAVSAVAVPKVFMYLGRNLDKYIQKKKT